MLRLLPSFNSPRPDAIRVAPPLPAHEFTSFHPMDVTPEAIVDRWLYDLECQYFLGDSFPRVMPQFGPGVIAAFLGLKLVNGKGTVWFEAPPLNRPFNHQSTTQNPHLAKGWCWCYQ